MTEIIKFDHVTKRYGDKIVIDNINFSIKTGEFITILGKMCIRDRAMRKELN